MATVNEYDTFDYLKPADYLPAKEARDREINKDRYSWKHDQGRNVLS